MSSGRVRKVADRIQVIVAELLERRIKDVRLGFVTVTDVRVTGDSQHATVFYTVLGDDEQRTASGAALESAKGLIRSEVGKQLGMRHTPTIEFILDALPETAAHIEELLAKARQSDAEVATAAARATYAGDADPYKHPDDGPADFLELDEAVNAPAAAGSSAGDTDPYGHSGDEPADSPELDEDVAQAAARASYAGDADPSKHSGDEPADSPELDADGRS